MGEQQAMQTHGQTRHGMSNSPVEAVDYGHALISSRRVEGTPVFSRSGERLGTIHSVMIEKRSGTVPFAVLEFGGFMGVRTHVHPVPWQVLTYDVDVDGYVVDMSREQLAQAPTMRLDDTDRPIDQEYQERVSSYWGTLPWWGL